MAFDQATIDAIASSLKAGHYNLLLGAGASLDSENPRGRLPSGNSFRSDLCKLKGARDNSPLQRVYATLNPLEVRARYRPSQWLYGRAVSYQTEPIFMASHIHLQYRRCA